MDNPCWGCQGEYFGAEWCLSDKSISQMFFWEWKKEMGAFLEIWKWIKMFICLTWGKDWDVVQSQAVHPGSYTAFQGWRVDNMNFIYFEIYVE